MNVRLASLFAAAAAAVLLVSCTKSQTAGETGENAAPKTHHLRFADGSGDLPGLNPHFFAETSLGYLSELTMAYMVRYDVHNQPVPELATVVPTQENGGISKDGKSITWHLRKGVKWSDGVPFDGDDVVWTTHAILNTANNEIGRDGWNLITGIDEPDKYTVIFHMSKPYASFLPTFYGSAGANPCILPKHLLAKYPDINHVPYNALPVGIGPFRYTAWHRGESVEMEANPYYWRGQPKLQKITYKIIPSRETLMTLMQTGDVDLWPQIPPQAYIDELKAISKLTTIVQPAAYFSQVSINVSRPLVSDVRVRQAIRYAIDRQTLVTKIAHGYGILQESLVSPVVPIAPKNIPLVPFDPAKAQQLLDQAGWKPGPDGIRVKDGQRLTLALPYYTGSAAADSTVELIRSQLKAVGIEIQTRKYDPARFFDIYANNGVVNKGDWDLTTFLWQSDPNGDYSNLLECNQIPPNGQDDVRFCDKQVDAWFEEFKGTYSVSEHAALLQKIMERVAEQVPMFTLYVPEYGFSWNKNLTGYTPGAQTPFDDMMNVDI